MFLYDGARLVDDGMFQGFNGITYTVILLQVQSRPPVLSNFSRVREAGWCSKD